MTRTDAARNRAAVLDATERIVRERGVEALRIADVARLAGVGPGTVYRGFGSKGGLLRALLDDRERTLQRSILHGDPPLGPGAPAGERLEAFLAALHELTSRERRVLVASEEGSPVGHLRTGAHDAWRLHLAALLGDLHPGADAIVLAELLLAPFAGAVHVHLMDDEGRAESAVAAEVARLARALARP